jgi:hypothetical protein
MGFAPDRSGNALAGVNLVPYPWIDPKEAHSPESEICHRGSHRKDESFGDFTQPDQSCRETGQFPSRCPLPNKHALFGDA